jgi:hypothetical protein
MRCLITFLLIFFSVNIFGQIKLQVKNLIVYNAKINMPKNMLIESLENGPFIQGILAFKNTTDSVIKLLPSRSQIVLSFIFKNKTYSHEIVPILFVGEEFVEILPGQTINVDIYDYLILGTDIHRLKDYDYTKELQEILPKIQIIYMDKNINIKSDEIKDFKISEN